VKISFASDNNSGIHPEIMKSIEDANKGSYIAYGEDPYTIEALKIFKEVFGQETETFFVLTGTGANITALQTFTDRFNAVICANTSHINVDECGSLEHILGVKLLTIETQNGKILPDQLNLFMHYQGDQHHVQPNVVSISQPTELGTLYTIQELRDLVCQAHKLGLKVHLDGARLANAAVALNCQLRDLTTDVGIDVLSFGGTKNGLLIGEAVVFFDKENCKQFRFIRKQNTQLVSKMRYISAQFIPYFKKDLWKENAQQANLLAKYLYHKIILVHPEIIAHKPQTNAIFIILPKKVALKMQNERFFYTWDAEHDVYRFMTSFDMTQDDVDEFASFVLSNLK